MLDIGAFDSSVPLTLPTGAVQNHLRNFCDTISVAHHPCAMNPCSSILIQKPKFYKLKFKISSHFKIPLG